MIKDANVVTKYDFHNPRALHLCLHRVYEKNVLRNTLMNLMKSYYLKQNSGLYMFEKIKLGEVQSNNKIYRRKNHETVKTIYK